MFSNKDLKNLIIPLFLEQLLTILVGLADTFVISFVSEAAVSGVSLVNSFNTIFIFLFTALAVYNAGAALYRSIGKTSVTMYIAVVSNVINVAGNLIGVFVLHAGVAGVAYPSLIARTFSAAAVTVLCFRKVNGVYYKKQWICRWNAGLLKRILGIAQSIWSLAALVCVTMGPVFITVIGQCMGAGDTGQAEYYFHKLLKVTLLFSVVWNTSVFVLTPVIMPFFDVAPETRSLTVWLVLIHNVFNCIAFPFADPLGKGLRAAGDVKFTVVWSIVTTIGVRLLASVLLAIVFNMGVIGIALAMSFDWCVRAVAFYIRFRGGKWKKYQLT